MKSITRLFILLAALSVLGCGGSDPSPTKQDKVRKLLMANTWKIQSVTVGDLDAMELFEGLTVSFTKDGFTSANGGPVWPASGLWEFGDSGATKIIRSDDVEITITLIDENAFSCSLYWDENIFGSGRTDAVEGDHVFVFAK